MRKYLQKCHIIFFPFQFERLEIFSLKFDFRECFVKSFFFFSGTIMSGLFVLCCCCGRTRYDEVCDGDTKFCSFVMNCLIGLSQFATIILCLVGWCWSIGWGITLISVSSK